jgi:hypothetical protein
MPALTAPAQAGAVLIGRSAQVVATTAYSVNSTGPSVSG